MAKVYFLGAGSSVGAGYPTISDLNQELENEAQQREIQTTHYWDNYLEFKNNLRDKLGNNFDSENPELVLSFADLIIKSGKKSIGQKAKDGFRWVLEEYLAFKHFDDNRPSGFIKRKYLQEGLGLLENGDTVITTNWDTLIERTLFEQEKWFPMDGYGFSIPLYGHIDYLNDMKQPVAPEYSKQTMVKVIKLHGSYGWMYVESRQLFYLKDQYLNHLYPKGVNERVFYHEEGLAMLNPTSFLDGPFIFPTYLKDFENHHINLTWGNAAKALFDASEVIFLGYSLPIPDSAVRALLVPLCNRFREGAVKIKIVDPSQETLNRWQKFFELKPDFVKSTAQDFFQSS